MLRKSFKTYQKSNKLKISYSGLLLVGLVVCPIILLLNDRYRTQYHNLIEEIFQVISFGAFALLVIKYIVSFSEKQKLCGEIAGNLELFIDRIEIGERIVPLTEIKRLQFQIQDYEDRRDLIYIKTTFPKISNGFNNLLEIELLKNEKIKINFQQEYDNEFARINRTILIEYYKKKKLPLLNLLDILQISKYEEIQEFKQTIANTV